MAGGLHTLTKKKKRKWIEKERKKKTHQTPTIVTHTMLYKKEDVDALQKNVAEGYDRPS